MKNIAAAQRAVDFLVEYPEAFNMDDFGTADRHGLRLCFAGAVIVTSGNASWQQFGCECPLCDDAQWSLRTVDELGRFLVPCTAQAVLGIDGPTGERLFYASPKTIADELASVFGDELDLTAFRAQWPSVEVAA